MSLRWPNGIVNKTFTTPTTSSASGAWKLNTVAQYVQEALWPSPPPLDGAYFYYVSMLLPGEGANGVQNNTFLDSSSNALAITRAGNPTQGTFSSYGSLWSNYFGGQAAPNTDKVSFPSTSALDLGTSDFTLECWFFSAKGLADYYAQFAFLFGKGSGNDIGQYAVGVYQSKVYFQGLQSSTTLSANKWYHIAVVRSSGTVKIFINGVFDTSSSITTNFTSSTTFNIGDRQASDPYGQYPFNGYISNVRVVKGTAIYSSNFTPSTTPLTAVSGTALLTCQSNRFIDNSSNALTVTLYGTPAVQRFSPFNPTVPYDAATNGGSGYFDGTGDYLTTSGAGSFNASSGDWTVEAWMYCTDSANKDSLLVGSTSGNIRFYIVWLGTNFYFGDATNNTIVVSNAKPVNQWFHFACVKNGSTYTAYINGTSVGTSTTGLVNYTLDTWIIGYYSGTTGYMKGYISGLRVLKGTALYTTNFTPPTSPPTNITNTNLLCNFTNAGITDAATISDLETVGSAQISTAQYKFGGSSMYFNGSGSYLLSTSVPSLALGGGDFTIELFCYPNADGTLMDTRDTTQNGIGINYGSFGGGFYVIGVSGIQISSSGTFSTGAWYHVAVVRNSGVITLYVNGVNQGTASVSTNLTDQRVTVGAYGLDRNTYQFNGYIDDFRITKGYARYTANFTPPTTAFPAY